MPGRLSNHVQGGLFSREETMLRNSDERAHCVLRILNTQLPFHFLQLSFDVAFQLDTFVQKQTCYSLIHDRLLIASKDRYRDRVSL